MTYIIILKIAALMCWRLWHLHKKYNYDVVIWGVLLGFLTFASVVAEIAGSHYWGLRIMGTGSLIIFFAARAFHKEDIDKVGSNAKSNAPSLSVSLNETRSENEDEFVSVKSYVDHSDLHALEKDKAILSENRIYSRAKTLGITNLLVRKSDFTRACELLGVESTPLETE